VDFSFLHQVRYTDGMKTATLTCPSCAHAQETAIPENGCLAFYTCEACGETISVPKNSDNCCVICEYSDTKCPAPNAP